MAQSESQICRQAQSSCKCLRLALPKCIDHWLSEPFRMRCLWAKMFLAVRDKPPIMALACHVRAWASRPCLEVVRDLQFRWWLVGGMFLKDVKFRNHREMCLWALGIEPLVASLHAHNWLPKSTIAHWTVWPRRQWIYKQGTSSVKSIGLHHMSQRNGAEQLGSRRFAKGSQGSSNKDWRCLRQSRERM